MPTIVQTFQGKVTALWGHASIRGADGKMHPLKLGDLVHQGDVILTSQDGIVRLSPEGSDIELAGGARPAKPAVDEIDRVINALNDADPQVATAAGLAGGDGAGDLTPGLRVERVSEGLTPVSLLQGGAGDEPLRAARDVAAARADGVTTAAPEPVQPPAAANTAPSGADAARAMVEDGHYVVAVADFGFTDPNAGQTFAAVRIDSIPTAGALLLDGVAVAPGTVVAAADIAAGHLTFVPAANANGAPYASFSFSVQDSAGAFDPTPNAINFSVTPANDVPIARNDLASTPINTPTTIAVLGNDGDIDGDPLIVTGATLNDPALGSVTINPDGTLGFTPAANVSGSVVISYSVADPSGASSTATVTVNVGSNNPPAGADATVTLAEDTAHGFASADFGFSDTDAGQTLANVRIDTLPAAGTLTFNGAAVVAGQLIASTDLAQLVFTPAPNGNGASYAGFTFSVQDSAGAYDPAPNTITFNVTPLNDGPAAAADAATALEDTPLAGNVLANDSDVDGDTLTVTQFSIGGATYAAGSSATLAGIGTLVINADGGYSFTPAANYHGAVPQATYTVSDGSTTASSTLSLSIDAVNDAPLAQNDLASTPINTALANIDVLGNDADLDGDPLSVTGAALANPALGSVSVNPDGSLNFTPANNVSGPVTIVYTISDGQGATSSATLTVNVGANTPPAGADASITIDEDTTRSFTAADFGYTDADAGQTLANVRIDTLPAAGTLTFNGAAVVAGQVLAASDLAQLVFTPAANASGNAYASFTFSVQDSAGAYDPAPNAITLNVTPVADGFSDADEVVSVSEDASLTGSVLNGTSSVDGAVSVTQFVVGATTYAAGASASIAGVGSLTIAANGAYTFTPVADYNGPVPVATYTLSDGVSTDTSTLAISVNPAADAAVISGVASGATVEDTALIASGKLEVADPDAGEAAFQPQAGFAGTHGTFSIDAAGNWTYTLNNADPAVQALGAGQSLPNEVFTVRSIDGTTANVTVTITGTDDAPVISSGTGSVIENTAPTTTGTLTATDVDNPALAFVPATVSGNHGALTVLANGEWTYTLDARAEPLAQNQVVNEQITVQLTDGSTTTVSITITGTNDAAVITGSASGTVTEDATLVAGGSLAATDIDSAATFVPQNVALTYGDFTIDASGTWTYTLRNADANVQALTSSQHPTETVVVTTADGTQQQITLTINGANETPTAVITPAGGSEDALGIPITLAGNDVDGTLSSFTVGVLPQNGTLFYAGNPVIAGMVIPASGNSASLTFVPDANWNGSTTLTFSATDNEGATSAPVLQSITVTAVNDAPVAQDDAAATPINTPLASIDVLGNDGDVDGDTLSVTSAVLANPALGSVSINPDGTLNFAPASNVSGPVTITYTIADANGATSSAVLTVNVGANTPPAGTDALVTIAEDTSKVFSAADFGYSDADAGQAFASVRIDTLPAAGTLTLNGSAVGAGQAIAVGDLAQLVFTPAANANGNGYASFTFSVQDSAGAFDPAPNTVTFNVTPVNDAPLALPNTVGGPEDSSIAVSLSGSDIDGSVAFVTVTTLPANGTLYLADGTTPVFAGSALTPAAASSLVFKPAANFNGSTSLTFTVTDDLGAVSTPATETINVAPVNDAPTITAPAASTGAEDTVQAISGVSIGDVDGDSLFTTLSVTNGALSVTPSAGVTILGNGGASVILVGSAAAINAALATIGYTPRADYNGGDTLHISTNDGLSPAVTKDVLLTISPVADSVADTVTTNEDTAIVFNPITGANEAGGADNFENIGRALTAVGTPSHGSVSFTAAGNITYTPAANYNGPDSFTYTVTSGGVTETATITVNVSAVNDAPVAQNDSASVLASGTVAQAAADGIILSGAVAGGRDSDVDGDALTVARAIAGGGAPTTAITLAGTAIAGTYGDLLLRSDGSYSYTASRASTIATGVTVNDVFTHQVSDGHGGTANATLTVQVGGQADTVTTAPPATSALLSPLGLRADYYGYNEWDPNGQNANRRHSDDGTLDNLDSIADITTIVNGRNAAVGASGSVVGTSTAGASNAADAHFTARTVDYGNNPAVGDGLGTTTVNIAAGGSTAGLTDTNSQLYHFLHRATNGDQGSLSVTAGTGDNDNHGQGPTSGLGNTTDAAIRMTGEVYFAAGVYDIRVTADDGFRLTLDGQTVAQFDANQSPTTRTFTGIPIEGGMTPLELIYWEQGGNARLTVEYRLSGTSTYQTLSTDNLPMFAEGSQPALTETQQIVAGATPGSYLIQDGSSIVGGAGNDTITGNSGNDKLSGGGDNDVIAGGAGHDVIIGGAGNDTLTGGAGHDVFRWELADRGTPGAPARDVIVDFDNANYSGDVLDLRDILVNDKHAANTISIGAGNAISVSADNGTLGNYLHFSVVGGNTVVEISSNGGFSGGYQASAVDQVITVNNVNLMAGFSNDSQVINDLLKRGKMITTE